MTKFLILDGSQQVPVYTCNITTDSIVGGSRMAIDPNKSKEGKLCLAEVHPQFLNSLARVSEISKKKGYELLNWIQSGTKCYFNAYLVSASLRHIAAFQNGQDYNIEKDQSGLDILEPDVLHLESAAYNLLMAATLFRMGRKDLDDRKVK